MKKNIVARAAHTLFVFLFTVGLAMAEDAPQLQKLKHSVLSPSSEQVVLQLNGSYSPNVFTLKGETPRVIFDFADMTHSREVKSITTKGAIVKRVRVGMHGDETPKTRIVFDVATLKDVTYTQSFDEATSTLTIHFTRPAKTIDSKKTVAQRNEDKPAAEPATTTAEPAASGQPPATVDTAVSGPSPRTPASTEGPAPKAAEQVAQPSRPSEQTTQQQSASSPSQGEAPAAQTAGAEPVASPAPSKDQPSPAPAKETPLATEAAAQKPVEQSQAAVPAPPQTATAPPAAAPTQPAAKDDATKTSVPGKEAQKQEESAAKKEQPVETTPITAQPAVKPEAEHAAAPAQTEEPPRLEYVKFDATSPKGEMVLFKLNGFHPPAVHGVEEGIPRVICDFNNTKLIDSGKGKNTIKTNGKFVKVIRTSTTKKPEKVRVVIDLEPNRSYDLQQVFFKEDNLFVIIVNTMKK